MPNVIAGGYWSIGRRSASTTAREAIMVEEIARHYGKPAFSSRGSKEEDEEVNMLPWNTSQEASFGVP